MRKWIIRLSLFLSLAVLLCIGAVVFYHLDTPHSLKPLKTLPVKNAAPYPAASVCHTQLNTVLSVDGGGAKGIIPLTLLAHIESQTHRPLRKSFNLMTGVSTGAIIATALSLTNSKHRLSYNAHQILEKYMILLPAIFHADATHKALTLNGVISPLFSAQNKQTLLTDFYHQKTLADLAGKVLLVGTDYKNNNIITFCNWRSCSLKRNHYFLRNLLNGLTSPTGFFAPQYLLNNEKEVKHILADANYTMNDPSILAYHFAKQLCPAAKETLLLSLGTGSFPKNNTDENEQTWGTLHWLPKLFLSMVSSSKNTAKMLLGTSTDKHLIYLRLNPKLPHRLTSPMLTASPDLKSLQNIANHFYQAHKQLFHCLVQVLGNKHLSAACLTRFKAYQKKHH